MPANSLLLLLRFNRLCFARALFSLTALALGPLAFAARKLHLARFGRVISARAVSGPTLLHEAAVAAARQARFTPTLLSGQPVKVSGVITYNFVYEQ
ncbi:energy transducer TonB [Pyrinomonas sp.]|uniref:energy transducer TonB n=1 Tax=Pyrinomonas sp. TaxID=2080306 RepID=UPI00332542F8